MPLLELHSLESFCSWLNELFTTTVPFGLSLRLRPLLTSPDATLSRSLVLVRPHIGHVLLSHASEEEKSTSSTTQRQTSDFGGGAAYNDKAAAYAAIVRPSSSRPSGTANTNCCGGRSWAAVLQTLLHITRSDGSFARESGGESASGVPALDGVGRKVHLFTTLLHHCVPWWPTEVSQGGLAGGATLHASRRSSRLPFLFFAESAVAVPLHQQQQPQGSAPLCFLRVLRRLSQRGGWRLTFSAPRAGETERREEDWLDYVVQETMRSELHPSGDCSSLYAPLPSSTQQSTEGSMYSVTPSQPCVSVLVATAVLWHVLATEVDGEVHAALHRLLCDYIFGTPSPAEEKDGERKHASAIRTAPLSRVRQSLERLVRHPDVAFGGSSVSSTARSAAALSGASAPPVRGPVTQSRVLPAGVFVMPFTDAATSTLSPSSTPCFFLRGVRRVADVEDGLGACRTPMHVLLLRVDPEGGWLPAAEEQACQRTFYASFQRQGERYGPRRASSTGNEDGMGGDGEEDDFAFAEARGLGQRVVGHRSPGLGDAASTSAGYSPSADRAVALLTYHVLRHAHFAEAIASVSELDQFVWVATVRLYLYALLHRVRVVVTPERLPSFAKTFGYRHVRQLHRALCHVHRTWKPDDRANPLLSSHVDVSTLLAAACAQEPPVAIYLVDQLGLEAFTHLQQRLSVRGKTSSPATSSLVLPIVLCRDTLRHSEASGRVDARDASAGVLTAVTHCGVLSEEVLCTAWAHLPSGIDADSLLEACAGMEQCFVPNSRNLCVLAVGSTTAESSIVHLPHASGAKDELGDESLLLVAPTRVHTLHYGGLLLKAALALLDALPDAAEGAASSVAGGFGREGASLCGLVRGGGGFYVAVAKQLHQLRFKLQSVPPHGFTTASAASDPRTPEWGSDVALRERRWVCYLLHLLSEACAALTTHHAEPVIEASVEVGTVPADAGTRPWMCGPRARRRLWLRVLRGVVESSPAAMPPLPILHVRHADVTGDVVRCRGEFGPHEPSTPVNNDDSASIHALGVRVFAARSACATRSAAENRNDDAEPLFLEPIRTNVRAVREALSLLLHTLTAALP